MSKIIAIIQARLGSKRLPNKVLLKIPPDSGVTCLERVIERVKKSSLITDIILTSPDGQLNSIARKQNIIFHFYPGARDVLAEYYSAAKEGNIIVRITGDCPLVDPEIIDQCIDEFLDSNVDLVYNTDENNGQLNGEGSDVEIFTYDALQRTYNKAKEPDDREHVCWWMRRNLKTKMVPMKKLGIKSLNTYEDYIFICERWEKNEKMLEV